MSRFCEWRKLPEVMRMFAGSSLSFYYYLFERGGCSGRSLSGDAAVPAAFAMGVPACSTRTLGIASEIPTNILDYFPEVLPEVYRKFSGSLCSICAQGPNIEDERDVCSNSL